MVTIALFLTNPPEERTKSLAAQGGMASPNDGVRVVDSGHCLQHLHAHQAMPPRYQKRSCCKSPHVALTGGQHKTAQAQAGSDGVSRPVQKVLCSALCTASHGPEQEMGARRPSVGGSVGAHFAGSSSSLT